ncbi:MAG: hypothetical protein L6R38_006183 [Xanthoria sp. 2 TBL-2021]|nr:MAG: hypothetical protein L6R38_006183 [Xanthoria sp. 2 TBL-2021]
METTAASSSLVQEIAPRPEAPSHVPTDDLIRRNNRRKAVQFKASHALLVVFFLWIFALHALGIYFFTKGFLLTRLVLDHKSECASPPIELQNPSPGSYSAGCWYPKTFDKAVVIIIDALRYDFTIPTNGTTHHFHNALEVLHETAVQQPEIAFLLPFIADPPTATLQRLKGLTTGTLPAFIDAGSNFAGTAIEEDNLVAQLRDAGKTLVHLGDDTWHSLFPGHFEPNLTHAYDSFNVWDLHTVDNGVTEHLLPLLQSGAGNWDVIFGHYLGVDHAGHRYGPDHVAMNEKLKQMDRILREIIATLDDETLLVVMGDHGMDTKGDHGGESDDEVEAALWMYSKKAIFGHGHNELKKPPRTAKERPVGQIDLVPTLALLLGIPIPFNNLGSPISEAFVGPKKPDWQKLASVNALSAGQIQRYQQAYSAARGLDKDVFSAANTLWTIAVDMWQGAQQKTAPDAEGFAAFVRYQMENLRVCRSLWARFDVPSMVYGIFVLGCALVILAFYARATTPFRAEDSPLFVRHIVIYAAFGLALGLSIGMTGSSPGLLDSSLLGAAGGSIVGFAYTILEIPSGYPLPFPNSTWGWLSLVLTVLQAIGFASNSFTIWEDEILLLFLSTFAFMSLATSIRQHTAKDRVLGITQSSFFLICTRIASLSRLCREEQMPYCRSTYYSSATASTSASWQLLIPFALAILLPSFIKGYYKGTRSYAGSAVLWIGVGLRMSLLASAIYWVLDAADDNDWLNVSENTLRLVKTTIAQLVLGVSLVAGTTYYGWATPCISIETPEDQEDNNATATQGRKPKNMAVFGYSNMHGSRYFLLVTNWLIAVILLQKPMGGGSIGLLALQILALLEIIDSNDLARSAIGPVMLAMLGNFHFFKTGHQATLSSIQWETAFIALKTIRYPWTPLLVILNTYGAQMITAVAVPLIVLWKQPPKKKGLLGEVAMAVATFVLYFAMINLATTMWAGWLRRHLMLYRIFSPRFMTGAVALLVVDMIGILVAIGGFRWNIVSVSQVFGWA